MSDFSKERDEAFIKAVMEDNFEAVRKYSKKYGVPFPKNRNVMKAGVYKAVQYCTEIPEEVKNIAMAKCLELGFNPLIKPIEGSEE